MFHFISIKYVINGESYINYLKNNEEISIGNFSYYYTFNKYYKTHRIKYCGKLPHYENSNGYKCWYNKANTYYSYEEYLVSKLVI